MRILAVAVVLLWIATVLVFAVAVARAEDCGIDAPGVCGQLP